MTKKEFEHIKNLTTFCTAIETIHVKLLIEEIERLNKILLSKEEESVERDVIVYNEFY
jgi:hypothetical protein